MHFLHLRLNAIFQMGVTLRGAIHFPSQFHLEEMMGVKSLRGILHQPLLVDGVYNFLMPGLFFMPKILEPLAGGCVPYLLNQLFAHIVYVWGCFPGPLGTFFKIITPWAPESKTNYNPANAEKAMEPMDIPLPFVYADNMLVNVICFGMLMFVSDRTHCLFLTMSFWAIFIYCFSRWQHLRFNKRSFFTTNSLDRTFSDVLVSLVLEAHGRGVPYICHVNSICSVLLGMDRLLPLGSSTPEPN